MASDHQILVKVQMPNSARPKRNFVSPSLITKLLKKLSFKIINEPPRKFVVCFSYLSQFLFQYFKKSKEIKKKISFK